MHACSDFSVLGSDTSLPVLVILQLTGHSCFRRQFQLFRRGFKGFLELLIFQINKIDASQLSRIVELRFLDSPVLLLVA